MFCAAVLRVFQFFRRRLFVEAAQDADGQTFAPLVASVFACVIWIKLKKMLKKIIADLRGSVYLFAGKRSWPVRDFPNRICFKIIRLMRQK